MLFTMSVHHVAASHYDAAQRLAWAPQPPDFEHWRRRLAPLHTLVADDGAELAGFISYTHDGYIDLLFTSPTHTRRGVASLLYGHVEGLLIASGAKELSTHASVVARPFFASRGFAVTEEQEVCRSGVRLHRFAMRKLIA